MNRIAALALLAITFCFSVPIARAEEQLTRDEVVRLFVAQPWEIQGGKFTFFPDTADKYTGTYMYEQGAKSWKDIKYSIDESGVIKSYNTGVTYTFFRTAEQQYEYFHSRSNRRFKAYPVLAKPGS